MAAKEQGDQARIKYNGEGDYVEARRYKAIYDAHDMARDVILEAKRQYGRDMIDDEALQTDARAAVEVYITEVEQMARAVGAADLLQEKTIHQVKLNPPDELMRYYWDDSRRVISPAPEPKVTATINGLWGFLTAPQEFIADWTIRVDTRHSGPQAVTASATTRMPVEASLDAFRVVNTFLEVVGLDLEPMMEDYKGEGGPGL